MVSRWDAGKEGGWPEHLVMNTRLKKVNVKRAAALHRASPLASYDPHLYFKLSCLQAILFIVHVL